MIKSREVLSVLALHLIILQPIVNSSSVIAVEGGEQVIGTQLVLPLMMHFGFDGFMKDASGNPLDKPLSRCSASLITSQIILTAAHCVAKTDSSDGSLYVPTSNFKLFAPGVDFNATNKSIPVEKVILHLAMQISSTLQPGILELKKMTLLFFYKQTFDS